MWEVSLKGLSADHMDEGYFREHLELGLKRSLMNGARSLLADPNSQLDVRNFGYLGVAPNLSEHQKQVAMYERYYYVGRAIEQAAVEKVSGKNPDLL